MFFRQLLLLLWKNFSLRRRQPIRNLVEIFWPLALFFILVLVRQRRGPEINTPTYSKPKALPTAGTLPFLQSFFCNFRDGKYNFSQGMPDYSKTQIFKFIADLQPILQNRTQLDLIDRLPEDWQLFQADLQKLQNMFNISSNSSLAPDMSINEIFTLQSQNEIRKLLASSTKLNSTLIDSLMHSKLNVENVFSLYEKYVGNYGLILQLPSDIRNMVCNTAAGIKNLLIIPHPGYSALIQNQLCQLSITQWGTLLLDFGRGLNTTSLEKYVDNIDRYRETLNKLQIESTRLRDDIASLQSFQGVIEDVRKMFNRSSGMSFNDILCGRTHHDTPKKEKDSSSSTVYSQIKDAAASQALDPIVGSDSCKALDPFKRSDCGWPGISEGTCLSMGCCFDSTIAGAKYCFCKPGHQKCCAAFNSFVFLISGVTGQAGEGATSTYFKQFISMILKGKVLYTPDTPQTRAVIEKVNSFILNIRDAIYSVRRLKTPIKRVLNFTNAFSSRFPGRTANGSNSAQLQDAFAIAQIFLKERINFNIDNVSLDDLMALQNESGIIFDLIDIVDNLLDCYNLSSYFVPMKNEQELIKAATDPKPGQPLFLSSIVFLNLDAEDGSFPKKVEYKLRLNPDFTPTTLKVSRKYWRPGPNNWHRYVSFGYVYLQDLVERAVIDIVVNKTVQQPGTFFEAFPYPCYLKDQFAYVTSNAMPLFMTLAWVYSIAMIVKSIVLEKERRLKEVMKVMGLSNSVYWMSWFITSFIMMLLSILLNVTLLKFGNVLKNSDPLIVLWLLVIFSIASINLCFLISVFFSRANVAAACGGIIYFFTYLPYTLTIFFENEISYDQKNVLSLFSTTAFGVACRYMARYEEQGIGIQWDNYYKSPLPGDENSFGVAINMLIVDCFVYFALMWYFEKVTPGQYGIPLPWYFPFTKSYWFSSNRCSKILRTFNSRVHDHHRYQVEMNTVDEASEGSLERDPELFETDPLLPLGVDIRGLVKIYSRGKKLAVDNLNLKLYEGQVTSLLGHNGAGKSTTMSILTGLFPPTEGTAKIYGEDIRYDIDSIRRSIGICPQHNVLFDNLTVDEHMWFYARLKGMSNADIRKETDKFLKDVGLQDKQNELSMYLSGGMKRKLSVALAFIAKAKTVILDEPTAGVDPYSRRSIWDLILKYKAGRTILLSTHYMDEADLLGDRISIISNGKLQCCGSSLFLKRHFGEGYHLTVVKDTNDGVEFDGHGLVEFICKMVPGSFLKDDVGTETCFVLPSSGRQEGRFEALFTELEDNFKEFGIKSYGISDTSLEEVFLKVCDEEQGAGDEDNVSLTGPVQRRLTQRYDFSDTASLLSHDENNESNGNTHQQGGNSPGDIANPSTGVQLLIRQFIALFIKRFNHARRSKKGFFSQILLPAVFVIASMCVSLLRPPRQALPALKLTPAQYDSPNYIFVSNQLRTDSFAQNLTEALIRRPGVGTECMAPNSCSARNNTYPFVSPSKLWNQKTQLPDCPCPGGIQKCSSVNYGKPPPTEYINTKDTIIDLTGRNISQYLITTMSKFIKQRYGGLSFGEVSRFYPRLNTNVTQNEFISNYGVQENAKVWYNPKGYHALPTYINVLNNAILRANVPPSGDPAEYGIVAYNHPMEYNREQLGEETLMQGFTDLMVAIFVIIALSFVPASFVVYLVNDRETKSKHIQFVGGLRPYIYWLATYTWDLVNYIIPASCCIIIFLAFNQKAYVSAENFPATILLLFLYGWSMTPLMYPSSFYFNVPSTAYIVLICLNLFVGIVGTIATFILELFRDDEELTSINNVLKQVFLIFPNYCLGRGLMDLARNQFVSDIYSRFGESTFRNPFAWTEIGRNVFSMFVGGLAYFILTLLIEYRFFYNRKRSDPHTFVTNDEEEDVANERRRVAEIHSSGTHSDHALVTTDLTKVYSRRFGKKQTLAVNRLSLGVAKGECFGLLGVNGAGKTSTFKMLTGDSGVSAGDAFINGHSALKDLHTAHRYMGYCPQFDALDDLLTARETLMYFARIRGATGSNVAKLADWAISMLGLTSYADKIAGDYSGGNKRKLSTAIALLGNPPVVLLDEPTTGMDPGARRFLWDLISSIVDQGRSVVFTSHSMEECEVLCTRIGIMVNGTFRCLGSPQHLRSKYGDGYTLLLRAKVQHVQDCQDFVDANFPEAELKDCHYNMLEYQVPSEGLLLSQVFAKLELLQKTNTMEDYSVTQTTLDQIFVNFARKQTESVPMIEIGSLPTSVDV